MDAATLYIVLTLPNGEQQTSIQKFPTMEACEAHVELLRKAERPGHQLPISTYVCEGHNPFTFIAGYGRSRRYLKLPSRQACTALQWNAYLRDRGPGKLGYCFEDPPSYRHSWKDYGRCECPNSCVMS